eukprot:g3440.t1
MGKKHLFEAAERGDAAKVESIIRGKKGLFPASITSRCKKRKTVLHYGVLSPSVLQAAIDLGADVDAQDDAGTTPLMKALQLGFLKSTECLLENGADPNLQREDGEIAVTLALELRNKDQRIAASEILIEFEADVNKGRGNTGATALHVAALKNLPYITALYLDNDANPNLFDTERKVTPLHIAAEGGHTEVCRVLIEGGAEAELSRDGHTAIHRAVRFGHIETVKYLLSTGAKAEAASSTDGENTLHRLMRSPIDRPGLAFMLLRHGAEVNRKSLRGATPLHVAAENGDDTVCTVLRLFDADVETENMFGEDAVELAEKRKHIGVKMTLETEKGKLRMPKDFDVQKYL